LFHVIKFPSVEEITSYLDWILSLHIAHRQLKSDFSPHTFIKGNDARITIRSKDTKKGSIIDQDVTIELHNGELRATAAAADLQETTEAAEQSYTWTGQQEEMCLVDKVKSWIG
jgi:mediator of RNA polymerase II transcription subunit 17